MKRSRVKAQPPDTTGRLRASTTRDLVSALLAEILIAVGAMLPRQVLPHQFYLITRRCTQRLFLFRPDAATNNAFLYRVSRGGARPDYE